MLDLAFIRAVIEAKKRLTNSETEGKYDEIIASFAVYGAYVACIFKAMNDQALLGMSCVPVPDASTPQVDIGSTEDLSAKYEASVMEKDVYA